MACKLALYLGMICIMTLPASADYTEELQSVFVDDVIFDCGNWSAVKNSVGQDDVKSNHYNWKSSKGYRYNRARMWEPSYHELPSDIVFEGGAGYVTWVYAYPHGFTYAIIDENAIIYTNETQSVKMSFGYLETPCDSLGCMNDNLDHVTQKTKISDAIGGSVAISTTFTIEQHHTSNSGKDYVTYYKTVTQTINNVQSWQTIDASINVSMSNFTDRCTVISVETPANITGIRIDAISQNITAFYEKHAYYMELNKTGSGHKFFDLKEHVFENRSNMTPIGVNLYSLPRGDYNISVTLYTPFEIINANITPIDGDLYAVNVPDASIRQVLCMIVVMFGLIFVGRSI